MLDPLEQLFAGVAYVRGDIARSVIARALRKAEAASSTVSEQLLSDHILETTLEPIRNEVERLVREAGGDAQLALQRHGSYSRDLAQADESTSHDRGSDVEEILHTMRGDRYEAAVVAGEGGMGVVYLTHDTELSRDVALKLMRPKAGCSDAAAPPKPADAQAPAPESPHAAEFEHLRARFLQEAWITGHLEHPGVVPIHEVGKTHGGVPYYTMRFVRGERTLRSELEDLRDAHTRQRLRLLDPYLELCETVRYAHSRGVVHRDLKPDNVALGDFGEVLLLDWGLAKAEGHNDIIASGWQEHVRAFRDAGTLATRLDAIGTPGYMSPEAARGELDLVGVKSDIYSLGVILFEILTGRLPFPRASGTACREQEASCNAPMPSSIQADVPEALDRLCAECLAWERDRRPASAGAILNRIRAWQSASALEREVDAHVDDAKAALNDAQRISASNRLHLVDVASAAVQQVERKMPAHRALAGLREEVTRLREEGIQERERATSRRVLARIGLAVLALLTVSGYVLAADAEARRKEKHRDHEQILQLADAKRIADVGRNILSLSLLDADLEGTIEQQLAIRDELLARRPLHERSLAEIDPHTTSPTWAWRRQVLERHLGDLRGIDEGGLEHDRAKRLRRLAVEIDRAMDHPDWPRTIADIGTHPMYGGLSLGVQRGLVPLGRNPVTQLHEFAHLGSGKAPKPYDPTGRLLWADDSAIVLVLLPGGSFTKGEDRPDNDDESRLTFPQHMDSTGPFFIAKHECTRAQWREVSNGLEPSFFGGERKPVEQVTWQDCVDWLGRNGLVLPSEAQWEYACRAGSNTRWFFGDNPNLARAFAWTAPESVEDRADMDYVITYGRTVDVGTKLPNAFGLYDMHGNVWEWCEGPLTPYPGGPEAPVDPARRVLRGGSWWEIIDSARSANRHHAAPDYRCNLVGVRPARQITKE